MDDSVKIIIFAVVLLVVLIITIATVSNKLNKKAQNTMFENVYNVLKNVQDNISGDSKIIRSYNKIYDFYFETPNRRYYFKVVHNPGNNEICVNNALKWQVRKSLSNDRMYFVDGIEPLMRMEVEPSNKIAKKIYIIYPNTKSLLKYINECEMIFIHPKTDVYGTNIIRFTDFENKFNEFEF